MIKETLQEASFKGVSFMWRRLTTKFGKDSVSHRYPGTNRRFVEDMGRLPKIFTIDAGIDGGPGGKNYLENKKALEEALSSPGPGYLVHPTYGRVLVTAKPATCTEENKALGYASYSLTFEKSVEEARPQSEQSSLREVAIAKDTAIEKTIEASSDKWFIPDSPAIFDKVSDNLRSLTSQINEVTGQFSSIRSDAFKVFAAINAFEKSISALVTQPIGLFTDLSGIYDQVMAFDDFTLSEIERLTGTVTIKQQSKVRSQMRVSRMIGFFGRTTDTGPESIISDETPSNQKIKPISYETIGAENDRITGNEASNIMALINAYDAIANADFDTTEQLDSAFSAIEGHFNLMLESEIMQTPVRDSVIALRIATFGVVNQKRTLTRDAVTLNFDRDVPLNVIQFMYSGEMGDFTEELNPNQDPTFATGEIKVLR